MGLFALDGSDTTASTSKLPTLRPEIERDAYKRYKLPDPETSRVRSWSRSTTVSGTLKDQYPLMGWKQKMAVLGVAELPGHVGRLQDLHAAIKGTPDWRDAKHLREAVKVTLEELSDAAGASAGADAGTELHTLSEWHDAGRFGEVRHLATPEQLADIAAYVKTMNESGIVCPPEYIERIVLNYRADAAGTYDRLLRLPDGRLVVGDLKTQKDFDFGYLEIAAQLATYAYADLMFNVETREYEPMPAEVDKTTAIVMHLPVGKATCALYEIDLVTGWQAALTAHAVRQLRSKTKRLGWPYRPPVATGDQLLYLISHAQTIPALEGLWVNRRPGVWSDTHIGAARTRRLELTGAAAA